MKLIMETLSPVQVGSGEELQYNFDYIRHNGVPLVVDQNRCFDALAAQGDATAVSMATTLSQALHKLDEPYGYQLTSLHGVKCDPKQIREQLKDAQWRPLIPGSSLKGAIRTALLAEFLRSDNSQQQRERLVQRQKGNPKTAVKSLAESFFSSHAPRNKAPNYDWMRAWKIGDTAFTEDDLCLADVRFLNLGLEGERTVLRWKDMAKKNSLADWEKASGVYVEALNPGAVAALEIHVDDFLVHDRQALQQLHWKQAPDSFASLRAVLNHHAGYRLRREAGFYGQYRCQEALNSCIRMMQMMEQEENAIYLQMGWGSGWRGMTGDWQQDAGIEAEMRKLYHLGKQGMSEFPKTRRLAVFDGAPSLPFGWLRLWNAQDCPELLNKVKHKNNLQAAKIADRNTAIQSIHAEQQRKIHEQELRRFRSQEEEAERERLKAQEEARFAAMTPFEQEIAAIASKNISQAIWELTKGLKEQKWQENDARVVALKLKELLEKSGSWLPEYAGKNKNKMKIHKRSVIIQRNGHQSAS